MAVQEVVRILRMLLEEKAEVLRRRHGEEAVTAAEDMRDVLVQHLQEESPYADLWEAFKADPEETSDEMIGALEAMAEAQPGLNRRLNAFIEEIHQLMGPVRSGWESAGGGRKSVVNLSADVTATGEEGDYGGQQTYLYGNVPGSTETPGREIGVDEADLSEETRLKAADWESMSLAQLFAQLHASVDAQAGLPEAIQRELNQTLHRLETEVGKGDAARTEVVLEHMRHVHRLAPEVMEEIIAGLVNFLPEVGHPVNRAAEKMKKSIRGEAA